MLDGLTMIPVPMPTPAANGTADEGSKASQGNKKRRRKEGVGEDKMPPNVLATTCKDSKSRLHCRPKLTRLEIITRSLMSMDNHTGTVAEVYKWIQTNIPSYKNSNSAHDLPLLKYIRKNLSSKKIFVQIKTQGSVNTWTLTPKTIADYKQKAMPSTANGSFGSSIVEQEKGSAMTNRGRALGMPEQRYCLKQTHAGVSSKQRRYLDRPWSLWSHAHTCIHTHGRMITA